MRIGRLRRLVRVVYTGKAFQFPAARAAIKPLGVAPLTNRDWRIDKDLKERHWRIGAQPVAQAPIGGNCRDNHHGPAQSFIDGKLIDAAHILIAVRAAEAEITADGCAQLVSVQNFMLNAKTGQRTGKFNGQSRFACSAQPGKPSDASSGFGFQG